MDLNEQYLEYNILENTNHLYLETDFYFSFPQVFLRFKNIKKLEIIGCRWSNLNCNQIPIYVEHLILTYTILPSDIMKGAENLINLQNLELNINPFFGYHSGLILYESYGNSGSKDEDDDIHPIPDLGNLKYVSFDISEQDIDKIIDDNVYKKIIQKHKLFENIKNRISNINIEDTKLIINL